ncbi:MAG TPA: D-alanyl-D-alanine carboxypeptidase/D-alanyl-D-alanine-endopeptidase [Mycobacteriales bacterium]|jgi:D-alanyl-D-alanine carboxypeptidase/D-alanyl-D-alanine-endopeptidase (penicillin-binding protein 4)|nr:D-alanyl-D-alanine carboxypeptidase/D-alanyl-D-alanine-endopeptidase [Mycobacteriales bacterium]
MRWRLAALAAAVVLVAAGGAFYVVSHPAGGREGTPRPAATARAGLLTPSPALAALAAAAPLPTRAGVARQLRRAAEASELGGGLSGLVVDASTGTPLFVRRPDLAEPPASTTKLLTAVAALQTLGPNARLTTAVVRAGRTLFLVGGGDVTLAATKRPGYPSPATLTQLAARTASAVAGGPFVLRYDDTLWQGPAQAAGWRPGYVTDGDVAPVSALEVDEGRLTGFTSIHPQPRTRDPAASAAALFGKALASAGVRVAGAPRRASAPHVRPIATVDSPPVGALVQRMLTDSDNDLAEALARTVAVHRGGPATFVGAGEALTTVLRSAGLPVGALQLQDGSGLSRLDRASARLLAAVLRLVTMRADLRPISEGLPIAGFTGTLAERYRHSASRAGAGVVRAKTGTLAGVNSLAGTVVDADGRLLVFAFLTDRAADPDSTEAALDRLAARLAACGCG